MNYIANMTGQRRLNKLLWIKLHSNVSPLIIQNMDHLFYFNWEKYINFLTYMNVWEKYSG